MWNILLTVSMVQVGQSLYSFLFERVTEIEGSRDTMRKRVTSFFHPLVHSPGTCNGLSWAGPKPAIRSFWVSHGVQGPKDPGMFHCARHIGGSKIESGAAGTQTGTLIICYYAIALAPRMFLETRISQSFLMEYCLHIMHIMLNLLHYTGNRIRLCP